MSLRLQNTTIIFLLYFVTEGVHGLGLLHNLEIRQNSRPLPSPTPLVILNDFAAVLDSCTLHNVSWTFAGPYMPLSVVATNFGVPQNLPPSSTSLQPTPAFSDGPVLAVPSSASNSSTVTTTIVGDVMSTYPQVGIKSSLWPKCNLKPNPAHSTCNLEVTRPVW
ncbi:hypothetical protein P691DRAFT_769725 [Macrolepiota fuliginosa MF-IS2]|uniref:Uncharacterized protein n=1 Tax=Macrolepiota fuliginosa MF-IS2 TaxID=1400762 RepID=A0A9P5WX29_9AGAR|nr:hypothetical protein P691DRAFT_769725 [Macrolepiota fuliginosa MF-IS2]